VHYRPQTGIISSIEYDHADIYEDLDRIKREFRKFVALIPSDGLLVACIDDLNVKEVIQSSTSPLQTYGYSADAEWTISHIAQENHQTLFSVRHYGELYSTFHTPLIGRHNLLNLLGSVVILHHLGVSREEIDAGFRTFAGIKRRQEVRGVVNNIVVIDDFAHHPTAVKATIEAVKEHYCKERQRIWSIFEPRTATTRRDVFQKEYASAFANTDVAIIADVHLPEKAPQGHSFSPTQLVTELRQNGVEAYHISGVDKIIAHLSQYLHSGDVVLIMSNGGFGGIHAKLLTTLKSQMMKDTRS
jgi:UDP-N-acetylmuramate: L-alanyl-gamma-D-glutamyl-meso-diaminopimelate ligase